MGRYSSATTLASEKDGEITKSVTSAARSSMFVVSGCMWRINDLILSYHTLFDRVVQHAETSSFRSFILAFICFRCIFTVYLMFRTNSDSTTTISSPTPVSPFSTDSVPSEPTSDGK